MKRSDTDMAERVPMLSIHPDAADRDDVAWLAAELMEANHRLTTLEALAEKVGEERAARKRWENADIDEIPERHKLKAIWHGTLMNLHAAYAAYAQGRGR